MTLQEAINRIDEEMSTAPMSIRDSWRVVRGDLRRRTRTTGQMTVPEEETTAVKHFRNVQEELKGRGERGGDGG